MDFSFDSEVFILLFLFDEEDFLGFDVEWAWSCLEVVSVLFFGFAVAVGFIYWLASDRSRRDVKVGFGLFLSVFLFSLGGLQDVFWFVFWGGGLPGDGVVWWWMPWFRVFGFWNSGLQLCLLVSVFAVVGLVWVVVLGVGRN